MLRADAGHPVLLDAVLEAAYASLDPKPGRSIVAPGSNVAHDDCCDGQVHVRLVSAVPNYAGTRNSTGCPVSFDLTLGIGVVRCAAVVDDRGRAPTSAQVTGDGHQMLQDMADLAGTLQDWKPEEALSAQLGSWNPTGPQGGCTGGEWTYVVRVGVPL